MRAALIYLRDPFMPTEKKKRGKRKRKEGKEKMDCVIKRKKKKIQISKIIL